MAQVGPAPVGSQLVADLDALLEGVTEIAAPGVPGPEAFPVVVGSTGGAHAPVVAAGRWQVGRVVALGHDGYFGYFNPATLEKADTGRLMTNALRWAAGVGAQAGPRIGVVRSERTDELHAWLHRTGHDAREIALTPESLGGVDVVAVAIWNQSAPELEALSAFVRAGGGLVTAATGWGWAYLHPAQDLVKDFAGNRLLAPVGIQWADDTLARTSPDGYRVDGPPPRLTHVATALDAVEAHESGRHTLTAQERVQAIDTLTRFVRALPADDRLRSPRLRALAEASRDRWPSAEQPVGEADLGPRLAATHFIDEQKRISPESVRAHPAAEDFPGPVPAAAPRITRTLAIDTTVPRWHSTGLYAPPGELITVKAPPGAAAADGFGIRVGVHSDRIWHQAEWKRMPEISRRFPISTATTRVANAFGGLIYVEVPVDVDLGTITVEIEGAVAAPRFVLEETDPAAWRDEIRHAPAPWAEIEGRNMIVTTDSREVRGLGDPAAVAEVWDRVLDLNAELAAWSSLRKYPERFVVDRQISAGYMHAGYPLMAHMDQSANLVDASHIAACRYDPTQSNWGFFHEVGHNHQSPDWTFDGTVEVTVNLFTLYAYEFLCGIPVAQNWRGSAAFRAEQMARYDFDSPDFEQWKRDPFLALVMYVQLQQAFGWEAYRSVFATYRALPDEERPKNDVEKRDQWLVRFSRQVGRNLGPFFAAWGVPTSRAARDSIADLPTWLPHDFPPVLAGDHADIAARIPPIVMEAGGRVSLDIAGYFDDLDSNTLTYSARWPAFVAGVPLTVTGALIESMATIWAVDEGEVEITFTAADASLSVSQDVHVTTTPPAVPTGTPSLRVIYAIPSDKEWRQPYSDAIQQAIEAIQAWYLQQLDGQTFAIHASVPEACHLGKSEAWFKEHPVSDWQDNTWARLREALQACAPVEDGFDQDHIWLVYADIVEECDPMHGTALGRGWNGITMIGGQDLRALTDSTYVVGPHCYGGSFSRWFGGLAHELGHGFNLLHPPGCDYGLPTCDHRAVMAQGLYSWPDAHLRAEDEIPHLLANRFIRKP